MEAELAAVGASVESSLDDDQIVGGRLEWSLLMEAEADAAPEGLQQFQVYLSDQSWRAFGIELRYSGADRC